MPIISPKIPSGLEELMRGLAKSVIKENPQNIYEFAAEYFENLLKERDGSVDQSYKKFATYKVYKKNKTARLKLEKENSYDVNGVHADNGFRKDVVAVNYGNQNSYEKRDSSGEKSIEEIVLPATSANLQALPKSQSSISSESEIHATVKKDASIDVDGAPSKPDSNNDEDEDIKNMVLDEDMAQAALKIQSTFRGHKVRREMKETTADADGSQEITAEEVEEKVSDPEIELKEPIENDPKITDNIEECENMNDEAEVLVLEASNDETQNDEVSDEIERIIDSNDVRQTEIDDEIADMVLDDEMEQAALKIQSTFRGHKVRKEVKPPTASESVEKTEEPLTSQPDESETLPAEAEVDNGSIQAENNESMSDEAEKLSVDESVQVEDLVQNEDVEKENDGTTEQEKVEEIETSPEIVTFDEVDSQSEENEDVTETPFDASSENFIVENDDNLGDKVGNDKDEPAVANEEVIESPDNLVDEANENREEISDGEKVEENLASNELEKSVREENVEEEEKNTTDLPKGECLEECEVGEQLEGSDKVESTVEESLPEGLEENANNQSGDAEVFLEKEPSVEADAPMNEEVARIEEIDEVDLGDIIESTDNVESSLSGENVNENREESDASYEKQQESEPIKNVYEESKHDEVIEENRQEGLSELPNVSENENFDIELDDENIGRIPVVEEICEKKSIHDLEPDQQIDESENIENEKRESSLEEVEQRDVNSRQLSNHEKSPSAEVEYETLKESFSDQGESVEEIDDKSQDLTDEKSIDGDETCDSKQNSLDEKLEEIQDEANVEQPNEREEKRESFKDDVDDIEMNSTQQTEEFEEREEHLNDAVESILQNDISPIELMDEVVNEYAGAFANELFNDNGDKLDQDLNNSATAAEVEGEAEQTIDPQLKEENPLKEIQAPKSIDLSQETVQVSQDEMEPIIDEILQPEKEDSEIPEETQTPMDEDVPIVAMEENSPSADNEEKLPNDEAHDESTEQQPQLPQIEDDVSDMVLDEEMEDAALKIQAAFRGHQVRKEQVTQQESEQENKSEENADEKKSAENVSTNVVIDQCSEEIQDNQDQEETEQQNTSADVEDIEETETVDQEETLEGKQNSKKTSTESQVTRHNHH